MKEFINFPWPVQILKPYLVSVWHGEYPMNKTRFIDLRRKVFSKIKEKGIQIETFYCKTSSGNYYYSYMTKDFTDTEEMYWRLME